MPRSRKRNAGSAIIEVSIIASVLVIMALLCANMGIVALASSINDSACRDAARAAAQAQNSASALQLAQAALKAHQTDGYYVTQPQINTNTFTYQDFAGNPPANTSPYVEVTTSCNVRIPCPIMFMGAQFSQSGTIAFTRTYYFPIVKTALYLP